MNFLLLLAVHSFAAGRRAAPPRLASSAIAAPSAVAGPISNEGPAERPAGDWRPYWDDFPGARVSGDSASDQARAATGPAEGPKWVEIAELRAAFIAAPDAASLDAFDGTWLASE